MELNPGTGKRGAVRSNATCWQTASAYLAATRMHTVRASLCLRVKLTAFLFPPSQQLDVSWNPLGSQDAPAVAEAIAKYLQFDTHLVHLDLSHTQLTAEGGDVIAKALAVNSSLVGIHAAGM